MDEMTAFVIGLILVAFGIVIIFLITGVFEFKYPLINLPTIIPGD